MDSSNPQNRTEEVAPDDPTCEMSNIVGAAEASRLAFARSKALGISIPSETIVNRAAELTAEGHSWGLDPVKDTQLLLGGGSGGSGGVGVSSAAMVDSIDFSSEIDQVIQIGMTRTLSHHNNSFRSTE